MSDYTPRFNDAQRAEARRRWEGIPEIGFARLAAEVQAAWGVTITRQALRKEALKAGWTKRGAPSGPLASIAHEPRPMAPARPTVKPPIKPPIKAVMPVAPQMRRPMVARTGARFVRLRGCPPGR